MVDPTTTIIQLAIPTRGSDIGTWDTPVNGNMGILDSILGGVATIGLNNSNVVLSAGQFQSRQIIFNSTLTGSVTITFPASFYKSYEIINECSGSSANTITLATTVAGSQVVGCPPGELFEISNDGINIKFKNFGRVGSYWDYGGSSVPNWVSACTIPPYLNCDGTAFSSATYPALFTVLGSATLPDARGRARFALNQTTARITAAGGFGIDGNTNHASGGSQALSGANLPAALPVTIPAGQGSHTHAITAGVVGLAAGPLIPQPSGGAVSPTAFAVTANTLPQMTGTVSTGSGASLLPPGYVGGLTLIRAA